MAVDTGSISAERGIEVPATAPPPATGPLAGDPAMIGVPTFVVGSIALALTLINYVPVSGAAIPIILAATGIGQLTAAFWSAGLGQSAVAGVFGVFAGFWISYATLLLGLAHNWFGVTTPDVTHTVALFLISWLAVIVALTVATPRLPSIYTLLFVLVDIALVLVLIGTINASTTVTKAGGIAVFAFAAVGVYLFAHAASLATGGKGYPLGKPLVGG